MDIQQTYQRSGLGPAMAKFIAVASYQGPLPADYADQPAPDPAAFGLPAEDDGSRDNPLVGQNMITCTHYRHDFARSVVFPGGHDGFMGGEYGSTGKPEPFAATLREVLTG